MEQCNGWWLERPHLNVCVGFPIRWRLTDTRLCGESMMEVQEKSPDIRNYPFQPDFPLATERGVSDDKLTFWVSKKAFTPAADAASRRCSFYINSKIHLIMLTAFVRYLHPSAFIPSAYFSHSRPIVTRTIKSTG